MRKFSILIILVLLFNMFIPAVFAEENQFSIDNLYYSNNTLYGNVSVPKDEENYFFRVTFFLENDEFAIMVMTIRNKLFRVPIPVECILVVIQLVDTMDAIVPETYSIYAIASYFINMEER